MPIPGDLKMFHVETSDFETAVDAVRDVYCAHSLKLKRTARRLDTHLDVVGSLDWPLVRLKYGAPIDVEADYKDLFVVQKCVAGFGTLRQGAYVAVWRPGVSLPASADVETYLDFSEDFSQISLRLNRSRLEQLCSRWLGAPLEVPFRFDLHTFSNSLEQAWSMALNLLEAHRSSAFALPPTAEAALEEYILTLLLRGHPHNYSHAIEMPDRRPRSRLLRYAESYIKENAHRPITVSDVASKLNTSVRTLQIAFRTERQSTPTACLREARLELARIALQDAGPSTCVTDIAIDLGFLHLGRFSQYYRTTFGETPNATLKRAQRSRL